MSINAQIYLPAHVKTQKVFEVIKKVMGYEFEQDTFTTDSPGPSFKKIFDPQAPTSKTNQWHLVDKDKTAHIDLLSTEYYQFHFKDLAQSDYTCLYHLECEDSRDSLEPGCKAMYPPNIAVWSIIGKRLVEFFGGKMIYNDSLDLDDPSNLHICKNPKMHKYTSEKTSDDMWYMYHNLLFKEPVITAKEIQDMSGRAFDGKRDTKLLKNLQVREFKINLEQSLADKPQSTKISKI